MKLISLSITFEMEEEYLNITERKYFMRNVKNAIRNVLKKNKAIGRVDITVVMERAV